MEISKKAMIAGAVMLLGGTLIYDVTFNYVDWRTADRSSAGIAPKVEAEKQAVVQLYAARTYNWRKYFAVHSWIATKEKNADHYEVYQVLGFKLWRLGTAVDVKKDIPDRKWYGQDPELLADLRGEAAEKAIPKIKAAAKSYPYPHLYHVYPGPNSNTFISYILRRVPELRADLPPHAIGRDFIGYKNFVAKTESGTGWQLSLWGIAGISIGKVEGIELNLLGMTFGIDILRPALKLPFIGRLGFAAKS